MITLFRRIRQKLIDSGSVTKYLLYAIGEILLVVVGIMIALQINNWNEERQNRMYEITMLREVNEALVIDLEDVKRNISYLKQVQYSIREITRMKNDPDVPLDSLAEHFDLVTGYGASFIVNRSPFEAIESGGLDKISDPEIRNKLSELYGFSMVRAEVWANEVLRNELFKRNGVEEQIFGYNMVAGEGLSIKNERVVEDPERFLDHPKIDSYLYTSGWPLPATVRLMESAVTKMEEMIGLITKEIEE